MFQFIINYLKNFFASREEGQTLTEYALILVLIAVAAIVAVTALSGKISGVMTTIGNAL